MVPFVVMTYMSKSLKIKKSQQYFHYSLSYDLSFGQFSEMLPMLSRMTGVLKCCAPVLKINQVKQKASGAK